MNYDKIVRINAVIIIYARAWLYVTILYCYNRTDIKGVLSWPIINMYNTEVFRVVGVSELEMIKFLDGC